MPWPEAHRERVGERGETAGRVGVAAIEPWQEDFTPR
jgi:hypothetical protein